MIPSESESANGADYSTSHFPFSSERVSTHFQGADEFLSEAQVALLFEVFVKNVDPVVKILHPAVLRQIAQSGDDGADLTTHPLDLRALKSAILYATVTSLSDSECLQTLNQPRKTLISKLQIAAEIAMSEANILASESIHILQALVLYLVCFHLPLT